MVDQQLWKAKKLLDAGGVRFLPAINEELGGTAVLGTQRVEADPERTVEGVYAMWYGKGGVDRAGDALKHGNAYGSSPHGGVLVVAGDDHGCVSSSMPHQSDFAMIAWHMPVVNPANIADMLEFGLYGWALSRYSGAWVGFKAISETVESSRPSTSTRCRRSGRRRKALHRRRAACTTAGPTCRASRSRRASPRSSTRCAISRAPTASTSGSRRARRRTSAS